MYIYKMVGSSLHGNQRCTCFHCHQLHYQFILSSITWLNKSELFLHLQNWNLMRWNNAIYKSWWAKMVLNILKVYINSWWWGRVQKLNSVGYVRWVVQRRYRRHNDNIIGFPEQRLYPQELVWSFPAQYSRVEYNPVPGDSNWSNPKADPSALRQAKELHCRDRACLQSCTRSVAAAAATARDEKQFSICSSDPSSIFKSLRALKSSS